MRTSALLVQNLFDFSKFMVCSHERGGRVDPMRTGGGIFPKFVQTSFIVRPLASSLETQVSCHFNFAVFGNPVFIKLFNVERFVYWFYLLLFCLMHAQMVGLVLACTKGNRSLILTPLLQRKFDSLLRVLLNPCLKVS